MPKRTLSRPEEANLAHKLWFVFAPRLEQMAQSEPDPRAGLAFMQVADAARRDARRIASSLRK